MLIFVANPNKAVICSADGQATIVNVLENKASKVAKTKNVSVARLSDTGALILCTKAKTGLSNSIKLATVFSEKPLMEFFGHTEEVNCISINSEIPLFLSSGKDNQIFLWDTRSPHPAMSKSMSVTCKGNLV